MIRSKEMKETLRKKFECFRNGHQWRILNLYEVHVTQKENKEPDMLICGECICKNCGKTENRYANLRD